MHNRAKKIISQHRNLWLDKSFVLSTALGLVFLAASFLINYGAINYLSREEGSTTFDIILQNLPVINTDIVFSGGTILFIVFLLVLAVLYPEKIPFALKSISLFVAVRALFVIMTPLAPYPDHIKTRLLDGSLHFEYFTGGTDLFFSGHTGMPFLMALIFWENKILRYIFFLSSFVAAGAVLLGHLHYTIDVFSAFFITYGIFHIAQKFFREDYQEK